MTSLEQIAALENAALKEVLTDNRGVEGLKGHHLTKGFGQKEREPVKRASQLCAGCGCILKQDKRWRFGDDTCCSQQCIDDIRRFNAWGRSGGI